MSGPPRKPLALKLISGTDRRDRRAPAPMIPLPAVDAVPEPPDWLPNAYAVAEWHRVAPILVANRLLTEAGLSALGMLCSLHGKIVQLYSAGASPSGHMLAQWRNLSNDFGLTPGSRVRPVAAPAPGAPANRFAQRGKRPSEG